MVVIFVEDIREIVMCDSRAAAGVRWSHVVGYPLSLIQDARF